MLNGREFYGVDKLNLNGEHNDPSIIRSKLCFDLFNDIGLNASRAIHTEVYINGQLLWSIYFCRTYQMMNFLIKILKMHSGNLWKCLYPADLTYLGDDPDLYKLNSGAVARFMNLQLMTETNDYSQLARLN